MVEWRNFATVETILLRNAEVVVSLQKFRGSRYPLAFKNNPWKLLMKLLFIGKPNASSGNTCSGYSHVSDWPVSR